jgi:hypothetical protein
MRALAGEARGALGRLLARAEADGARRAEAEAQAQGAPAPAPQPQVQPRRQRRPSVGTLIEQAERKDKNVTSITMPDGTVLHFGEGGGVSRNPWDEVLSRESH